MLSRSLGFAAVPVSGVRVAKLPPHANGALARPQASNPMPQGGHIDIGQSVLAIALAVLPGRAKQRAARSAMRCGGGIVALAAAMGSTVAMDYAFKYLNGKSVQYLEGQMGKHAAATIKDVAKAAKAGQKWAQTASKIMTQSRFMKNGMTLGKILGGVACFGPGSCVTRMADGSPSLCKVEELQVGDLVLTMSSNVTPQWTQVDAVVAHPGRSLIDCTAFGQDSFLNLSATPNHKIVVRSGGTLMAVPMGDLELGQTLVGEGQSFQVVRMASRSSSCVYEVETREGTILLNGLLAMAASTDDVGSTTPLQELLIMQQISEESMIQGHCDA